MKANDDGSESPEPNPFEAACKSAGIEDPTYLKAFIETAWAIRDGNFNLEITRAGAKCGLPLGSHEKAWLGIK